MLRLLSTTTFDRPIDYKDARVPPSIVLCATGFAGFASASALASAMFVLNSRSIEPARIGVQQCWEIGIQRAPEVKTGARPFPVSAALAQTSFHGVCVDVIETRCDGRSAEQVAVKARSLLPEPEARLARTFSHGEGFQQPRLSVADESFFDGLGRGLLRSGQEPAYF